MSYSSYAGIDYGLGKSNVDLETRIRYGMIRQHSLDSDALQEVYEGEDMGFTDQRDALIDELARTIKATVEDYGRITDDEARECAEEIADGIEWGDTDNSGPYVYDSEVLKLQTTNDNGDLWVFKSPFYTHTQFCSPCVPGAGNLDTYCVDGPKTYCLSHDWFEAGIAPYPVYSVATGKEV